MRLARVLLAVYILALSACAISAQTQETIQINSNQLEILQRDTNKLGKQTKSIEKSLSKLDLRLKTINNRLGVLASMGGGENFDELVSQVTEMDQRLTDIETGGGAMPSTSIASTSAVATASIVSTDMAAPADTDTLDVSIKILSGTGEIAPAKNFARFLQDNGFKVGRVDIASNRFKRDTIFYSEGYHDVAIMIGESIGTDAKVKPLTWGSAFDIIAVITN